MTHRQLTVLTGSSASGLGGVIEQLGAEGIDIRAHCLVDNGDGNCKLRIIVSEPDRALQVLHAANIAAVVNDVLLVETDDKPGGLSRLLSGFAAEDLQVEYSYSAAGEQAGMAVMVFRFSDNDRAAGVLKKNGLHLLAIEA